jgi:hypothetical protein
MKNFNNISNYLNSLEKRNTMFTPDIYCNEVINKSYHYLYEKIIKSIEISKNDVFDFLGIFNDKKKYLNVADYKDYENLVESLSIKNAQFNIINLELINIEKERDLLNKLSQGLRKESLIEYLKDNKIKDKKIEKRIKSAENRILELEKKIATNNENLKYYEDFKNNFKNDITKLFNIYENFDKKINYKLNEAEVFVNSQKGITKILKDKIEEVNKKIKDTLNESDTWLFTKEQNFEEVIFFKDKSIAFKKNDNYETVKPEADNYNKLAALICSDIITYQFRKNKSYIPSIKKLYNKEKDIYKLNLMIENFFTNSQILKNYNFSLKDEIDKVVEDRSHRLIEAIDDKIANIVDKYKFDKFKNSIFSNKYKHLIDEEVEKSLKNIYLIKIGKDNLQKYIGVKLASFKTSKDLNDNLILFTNKINSFDIENLSNKANNLNSRIVLKDNNKLILEVETYDQCKELGSSSWCIVRHSSYFDSYVTNEYGNKQYIIYDLSLSNSDNDSIIGVTIKEDGTIKTAHVRNDDYVDFKLNYKELYREIILKDRNEYKLSNALITELNLKIENKNKNYIR